ncbi:DNA repair protein RadA [Zavarzinia compransoris]|uniref:DNA repair protein RadA n=1 Tax=Zavarzinia compransoris TaxID=1264899 RepID=A0A317E1M7_9PROT|nr:DNA repair protein RadA [Zavarzinia compransoris]PWR20050.1 DNA repair protein RadA [Zavarzinia compransoris]TDP44829.1 DNA repair protein RadA/Sms [Zavarzinia compransoris]
MARAGESWVCQACGTAARKWSGRCEACGAWNSMVEEAAPAALPGGLDAKSRKKGRAADFADLRGGEAPAPRLPSGIDEFDRVAGGGLVPGSALLVGGDPGIGKSTILLQVVAALALAGRTCAYISGEEAVDQVRLRAGRLGLGAAPVKLLAETSLADILSALDGAGRVDVVVIDSIQTMFADNIESAPGTVSQVRAVAGELVRYAKRRGVTMVLVGHVTKDGQIAGPRVVEHMVDSVLYFEGERSHQFRILRAVKNRFGPTDEIGVFEMTDRGLAEVPNPSAVFLGERRDDVSGTVVYAGIEGTRPLLVEIQALVAPSALGTPRRAVIGWDSGRLAMVMAVLEARCGIAFGPRDVYLNVAGGLRINEPGADLAVAAALVSAMVDIALPQSMVVFGEIGLTGEVRPVTQTEARLKEAAKLGFDRALVPAGGAKRSTSAGITEISRLADMVHRLVGDGVGTDGGHPPRNR